MADDNQQTSQRSQSGTHEEMDEAMERFEETMGPLQHLPMSSGDPIAGIAAGSVLLAWYQFYVKGNKQNGIFVGLWAPTLLAAAGYLQQKELQKKFRRGLSFK